jgi:phosphonate transport system permease protein
MTRDKVDATYYVDPAQSLLGRAPLRFVATLLLVSVVYAVSLRFVDFDIGRLWQGLPRLAHWAAKAWPPDLTELRELVERAVETVAMAIIGTTIGAIIAAPCCILAAKNITPSTLLYTPTRWFLNVLRGIDSFVFALLFVAAVGLGPFAGVLGVGLHSAGTIAKLWSEVIESVEPGPLEAVALTGANRLKVIRYALIPDVLPNLASIALYVWEFNVRASTVLGVVGAGGIGQELKNSVDLLNFSRVFTVIIIVLAMVTAIDQLSAWLRRRLV